MPATQTSRSSLSNPRLADDTGTTGTEDVKEIKVRINIYLCHELGIRECQGNQGKVSDSWPFQLHEVHGINAVRRGVRVFRFSNDQDAYLVEAGSSLSFWAADGMSVEDLKCYMLGAEWIDSQAPVDLDTARPNDPAIPSVVARRRAIEEIAANAMSSTKDIQILEGLFFPKGKRYLVLVENLISGSVLIVGSAVAPHEVEHAELAPWRRLITGIGEMLENGELCDWWVAE